MEGERDTYDICFTLEVAEYFLYQVSEADWLMTTCDSTCAQVSKNQLPLFISVTLAMN